MSARIKFSGVPVMLLAFGLTAVEAKSVSGQAVVQLPSFSQFSYSGSVLVPDRGTTSLGGVRRSASRSARRGLTRTGNQMLVTNPTAVHVQIIDQDRMDRQWLAGMSRDLVDHRNDRSKHSDPRAADQVAEGKALVRYARRQYERGDRRAAKYSYQMAIEILSGRLRQLAIAEYRRLY